MAAVRKKWCGVTLLARDNPVDGHDNQLLKSLYFDHRERLLLHPAIGHVDNAALQEVAAV